MSSDKIDLTELSPDVVIVGGGAVGLLAAVYLASRNVRVLILEAGPEQLHQDSQMIFQAAMSKGRKHAGLHQGRFRALGGTTNFWGGQLVRFDRTVFAERSWLNDTGWPISLEDIEPFYAECENLLGLPQALSDDRIVIKKLQTPADYRDDDLEYFYTRWLTEKNLRFRFGRFLESNANITVATNAPVTSLRITASGEIASVTVGFGPAAVDVTARLLVLANGTVEMIRLLQHDTTDGHAPPWAANPWLGRGFMDHLEGTIASVTPLDKSLFRSLFDNVFLQGMKLQPRLKLSAARQIEDELLGAAIHVKFETQEHVQNAKIFLASLLKGRLSDPRKITSEVWAAARLGFPMAWHYLMNQRIWSPMNGSIQLRLMLEHEPLPSSRITLSDASDKYGMRIPELSWAVSGEKEIRTIQAAAALAKTYFESRGIAMVAVPEQINAGGTELLASFVDTYHHMGGARMGISESDGVVDSMCRVFGCNNLYVMGAAVFPASGFANPTFTAMALALRTAETITRRVQRWL
ncbi:choline dehydrogenase-like flavoprotein [Bradyrhizobium sp. CIR18]|uniref:GMC oxidoreductase n=1 Tax=Bradyrhizobium sp. CIR18 TaxID=2663839 RepID=UPI001605ADC0|nr:GMC family oxidoreductase [Bradyrhizobium sp. CIR18]MBB4365096.1 choline dehydrogenase-like flavoprotein [Bradyrhizobium sp. CIR18]